MKSLLFLLCFLLYACTAFGASSATTALTLDKGGVKQYTITWIAHTDGTFADYVMEMSVWGWLTQITTDPGPGTFPTDNYDIVLIGSYSNDLAGGELADRSEDDGEQVLPLLGSAYGYPLAKGTPTLRITGNSVNGATGKVIITVKTPK